MTRNLRNSLLIIMLLMGYASHAQVVITTYAGLPASGGYAGDEGPATLANLSSPSDVAVDKVGNLYIADFINNRIRKVDTFGNITTFAGTGLGAGGTATGGYTGDSGPATAADLNGPFAVVVDKAGNVIFADGYNHVVRKVSTAGIITTIAGTNVAGYSGDMGPATDARMNNPVGVALDTAGNLYIADDHNNVIRKVTTSGIISTFAGNTTAGYTGDGGPATAATLNLPLGLAVDSKNNVYIADAQNNVVRKVNALTGDISTYAGGAGGTDTTHGYSGDAGPAINARLYYPVRLTFDKDDNLYISDALNNVVRKVTPEGSIYGFAGTGTQGFSGDGGTPDTAQMSVTYGVAINSSGIFYVADRGNEVVRRIGPAIIPSGIAATSLQQAGMSVYPNPITNGILHVNIASDRTEKVMLTVTNILGQTVSHQTIATNKTAIIKIDAPAGIYFVSCVSQNGNWKTEVVVE